MEPHRLEGQTVRLDPVDLDSQNNHHDRASIYLALRTRIGGDLLGFIRLHDIDRASGTAWLGLELGPLDARAQACGLEALRLVLAYAFCDLSLHRLTVRAFEYEPRLIVLLGRAGFLPEKRQRRAVQRDGRLWGAIRLGLLRREWEARQSPQAAVCAG